MLYELIIDHDSHTLDEVAEIAQVMVKSFSDNLDDDASRLGFIQNGRRILVTDGVWGMVRQEEQDVKDLSLKFPESEFILTKVMELRTALYVEDLTNYSRSSFQNGKRLKTYTPKPIQWVEKNENDEWFNA